MKRLILAAALLASATIARAQDPNAHYFTGNYLYEAYQEYNKLAHKGEPGKRIEFGFYTGYVSGIVDSELLRVQQGGKPAWCQPDNAELQQYYDIVGQYIESHPDRRQFHRATLVYLALAQAWPCQ